MLTNAQKHELILEFQRKREEEYNHYLEKKQK
jgi:hypothetical protein